MNRAHPALLRVRRAPLLIGVVVALVVAVHLGLAGFAIAHWSWWMVALVVAVAVKLAFARRVFRRPR